MLRVMTDANIVVSAVLFPNSVIDKVFRHILINQVLLLSQYTLNELEEVFKRKFPDKIEDLHLFIKNIKFELINTPINDFSNYPKNRDNDDIPVLAYAIAAKADVFVTGDKDFEEIKIDIPEILTPKNYREKYM